MTASRQPTNHPSYFIEDDTVIWSDNDQALRAKDGSRCPSPTRRRSAASTGAGSPTAST